ncbi:cilia- and flagella-associated protein 99-like [Babylonia areolata]|uniref:cilia- and flagella-associated protein 99-like n=1 Tax=Babylonia areolata TaxID=304850 RepID=UPI003FCFB49F
MSEWHERMLWQSSHLLATYDSSLRSVEEHVTNFIQAESARRKVPDGAQAEADHTFLKEVFSGCVQYTAPIGVILEGFYNRDGKNTLRSEQPMYHVLSYLALFRLDELGVAQFRKFIQCVEVSSAYKFLNFFLDEKNLRTWVKDGWSTIYDASFVQNKLLDPLLRWLEDLQEITKHLKKKIDNQIQPKKVTIPTTETRPFKLTQPKPRSVPMPEEIPKVQKHNPIPMSLYQPSQDQSVIAKRREENRQQAEERLMDASRRQFACANPEKTHKTREVLKNIVSEQDSKLDFERHRARPIPSFLSKETPIKMNTATILREGQLYQKQEEEEMKKLAQLEAGTMNSTPFEEWQASMRRKDLQAQLAEVERRRLMGKLSYEEAILARQNLTAENRAKVAQMKKEAEALMQEFLEQKLLEEQMVRNLVDQTLEGHRNARDAKKKLQESKRRIVQQVAAENRELMRQALEDAEAEMKRKLELIHQIRAAEASPAPRQKMVDLTATAGARLLSEMSIAELRERLALLKVSQKEQEEKKRDEILEAKQAKDQQLISTLETISKHRLEQTRSAAVRLEEKKKGKPRAAVPSSAQLTDLQRQVEEKRQARLRAQDQSRFNSARTGPRSAALIGQRKALEESRWQELEQTRERSARLLYGDKPYSQAANRLTFNPVSMAT